MCKFDRILGFRYPTTLTTLFIAMIRLLRCLTPYNRHLSLKSSWYLYCCRQCRHRTKIIDSNHMAIVLATSMAVATVVVAIAVNLPSHQPSSVYHLWSSLNAPNLPHSSTKSSYIRPKVLHFSWFRHRGSPVRPGSHSKASHTWRPSPKSSSIKLGSVLWQQWEIWHQWQPCLT